MKLFKRITLLVLVLLIICGCSSKPEVEKVKESWSGTYYYATFKNTGKQDITQFYGTAYFRDSSGKQLSTSDFTFTGILEPGKEITLQFVDGTGTTGGSRTTTSGDNKVTTTYFNYSNNINAVGYMLFEVNNENY